jgi:Na+-translocating ferredoxin:NAD+ oxidoreductase RnfG subunit
MRNTLLVILAIVGMVSVGMSAAVYFWLFAKVQDTVAQAARTTEEAQVLTITNDRTQTVRRIVRDIQQERNELNTYFVTEDGIVTFLEDVENLTADTGAEVRVQSVAEGSPIDKDGMVASLQVTIALQGTFQEVFHSLALLEKFPKAMTMREVRIIQNPTEARMWKAEVNIYVTKIDVSDKDA